MKYGILSQKHPEYNVDRLKRLNLLYCGGDEIIENAALFIPKEPFESDVAYTARLKMSSYKNYFAQIINDYMSNCFAKQLSILPAPDATDKTTAGDDLDYEGSDFYRSFFADADLFGNSFASILKDIATDGIKQQTSWIGVDFPKQEEIANNLLEEEGLGLARAYTYCIPTESVIDWEYDDYGNLIWLVLADESIPRLSFSDVRDKKNIRFKKWEKSGNTVSYEVFQRQYKLDEKPEFDDDVPTIDKGIVSFTQIPAICFRVPEELCIGRLIANLVVDLFRRNSAYTYAQMRSLYAILVYKQGAELPANGDLAEKGTDSNRGNSGIAEAKNKGATVIGPEDDLSFVEPDGKAFHLVSQELKELVDEIFRIVCQMSSSITSTGKSLGRSGMSKQMDNRAKEMILSSYGYLIKKYAIKVINLISEARKENIKWQAIGMTDYKVIERDILILEAGAVALVNQSVPSKTWRKHNTARFAFEWSDDIDPETQIVIKNELDEYYDKMTEDELFPIIDQDEPDGDEKPAKDK